VIVDSSAILGILLKEPGSHVLIEKLAAAGAVGVGAPTVVETGILLSARVAADAKRLLSLFLMETEIVIVPFGEAHARAAVDAYLRFGKGRHRAGLNFGDCLTYAVARLAGEPLLCTGPEFRRTDLQIA
jgi:ribonuclease VapC